MLKLSIAVAGLALAFATSATGVLSAQAAEKPTYTAGRFAIELDRSASNPGKVVIVLHITSPAAYAYDPASGGLAPLTPVPAENTNPIGGIGVVVKKNPGTGSGAERMAPDASGGVFAFPSSMEPGNYDITVTLPAHAVNTKGTGSTNRVMASKGAAITLHVTVDSKGDIRVNHSTLPLVVPQGATSTQ